MLIEPPKNMACHLHKKKKEKKKGIVNHKAKSFSSTFTKTKPAHQVH